MISPCGKLKEMKNYFDFTRSVWGRALRVIAGIGIEIFGYTNYQYPYNLVVVAIGLLILTAAAYNISVFAPMFGYPLWGDKARIKYPRHTAITTEHMQLKENRAF